MPEALWHFFLRERRVLMVAGTHGKTTSTAMMAHVLASAGRDPSMLVGGMSLDFKSNYRLGAGGDFVIEGDEYDTAFFDKGPKFLHYRPHGAIVTSVEFDHADIYRDLEHVKSSFRACSPISSTRNRVLAGMRRFGGGDRGHGRDQSAPADLRSRRGRLSRDGYQRRFGRSAIRDRARGPPHR